MQFYKDNQITILNGHVITELQGLAPESVHMSVLSPPYWGLRDYGLPAQVWDELPKDVARCNHQWGEEKILEKCGTPTQAKGIFEGRNLEGIQSGKTLHQGQFCQKCNAWKGSLGLEPSPDLYVQHIVQVFREIWRVLRKDATVWLNMGDSYATQGHQNSKDIKGKHLIDGGLRSWGEDRQNTMKTIGSSLKPKDLCGIPWRVALALQADGWWLRSDICWAKPNPMPESCTDRPTSSHEYIFLLSKSGTPKFWTHRDKSGTRTKPKADYRWVNQITDEEVDAAPPDWKEIIVCPNCQGTGIAMIDLSCEVMGQWMEAWVKDKCPVCDGKKKVQKWKRINLWRGHDYFYDADAVRESQTGTAHSKGTKLHPPIEDAGIGHKDWHKYTPAVDVGGRNLRSVWTIATQPFPDAHFATFPEKLVEPCIKAGTSEKGCCPNCLSPWVRVVEKERTFESGSGKSGNMPVGKHGPDLQGGGETLDIRRGPCVQSKTIGWKPSCECYKITPEMIESIKNKQSIVWDQMPIPCTVLDPFGGSGRTAIVANKLGRKCVIIELKESYCSMPLDELRQENIF